MQFRFITVLAMVLTLSAGVAVTGAQAQSGNEGSGILGGLFNKGGEGSSPIFINRNNQGAASGNTSASNTGVARSTSRSGNSGSINYRVVPNKPKSEMTISDMIKQSTAEQYAKTDAYVARKEQEAAEMAELYREQMRERLAAHSNDPSALQSMGAGGTGGVSGEQIKRKMIYKPDNDETSTGKKPIRLFNVR